MYQNFNLKKSHCLGSEGGWGNSQNYNWFSSGLLEIILVQKFTLIPSLFGYHFFFFKNKTCCSCVGLEKYFSSPPHVDLVLG